jgi:hypothetical protein
MAPARFGGIRASANILFLVQRINGYKTPGHVLAPP